MARDTHRVPKPSDLAADLDLDLAALARTGPGPYKIAAELPVAWIAAVLAHTDAEAGQPGRVDLEVTSIGAGASVLVRGALDVGFTVPCARCLDPASVGTAAGGDLCVHFVRGAGDALEDEEDREWSEDDAGAPDQHRFLGTRLDLRPVIEEQILVAYPMRALCSRGDACRGLCMHCGANLNDQGPIPGPCTSCGAADPQVPIVAAPADAEEAPPAESGWQAALRGLQVGDPPVDGGSGGGKKKKARN